MNFTINKGSVTVRFTGVELPAATGGGVHIQSRTFEAIPDRQRYSVDTDNRLLTLRRLVVKKSHKDPRFSLWEPDWIWMIPIGSIIGVELEVVEAGAPPGAVYLQ